MKPNPYTQCARIFLILLAAAGSLFAAPPANDNFAGRINLGNIFPTSATGTNVDATEQTGEPLPVLGLATVWWRWTAAAAGQVEINTAGSVIGADPLDTVLAVYTGTVLTSLVRVALNDESAVGFTSLVRFTAVAGTTYIIQVLGYEGAEGTVKVNIKAGPPLPVNDSFAGAVTLTTGTAASGTTEGSTLQTAEAVPAGITAADYYGSVWWAWTAPSAGWFRVRVTGADYDQVASVWTGTAVNALTAIHAVVGGSIENGASSAADLVFQATAGTRYPIAVGNLYSAEGVPVSLTVSSVSVPAVYNASLTVSPGAVNVTSAPATVNAVFRMVSAEPITEGFVNLSRVAGFYKSVAFGAAQRTSGTSTDGTYTVPILFSRYIEPGAYRISSITSQGTDFSEEVGELATTSFAAGAPRTINVANTGPVDTAVPAITSVNVTPTTVDVTSGPKTVTVTIQISDALSGFSEGIIQVAKVLTGSTQLLSETNFGSAQRTAGTAQNGTYAVAITFPADALGNYALTLFGVQDAVGNSVDSIDSTDPAFPGPFTGTIRVNRTPVHVLNSFTLAPASVNVTTGAVNVTASCSITTNAGEFTYGYLSFNHPTAASSFNVFIEPADRTSGNATAGTYAVTFSVPRYLTPGVYEPALVLRGTSNSFSRYASDEFPYPAGASTSLTVINTGAVDMTAPVIALVSVTPNSISSGSATPLVARLHVTDDLAGVDYVSVYLLTSGSPFYLGDATRISGTALDGIWELSVPIPAAAVIPGLYALQFNAADKLNQTSSLSTDSSITAQSLTITPAATNAYDTWTSANGLIGTDALAASDADRDGVPNVMEFALGMNPQSGPANAAGALSAGLPAANLTGSGASGQLTLGFWVPADLLAANSLKLTFLAQFTSNGTTWTDVPQTSFAIDGATSLNTTSGVRRFCTVTDPVTYSPNQPRFGRIRAAFNP